MGDEVKAEFNWNMFLLKREKPRAATPVTWNFCIWFSAHDWIKADFLFRYIKANPEIRDKI